MYGNVPRKRGRSAMRPSHRLQTKAILHGVWDREYLWIKSEAARWLASLQRALDGGEGADTPLRELVQALNERVGATAATIIISRTEFSSPKVKRGKPMSRTADQIDFEAEVYPDNVWTNLEATKVLIKDSAGFGENVWAQVVPNSNGLLALDNSPLMPDYRWQDVIDRQKKIVHRRWPTYVWFVYDVPGDQEGEEGEEALRRKVYDTLLPLGEPGFFAAGMGNVLSKLSTEEVEEKVVSLLKDIVEIKIHDFYREGEDEKR